MTKPIVIPVTYQMLWNDGFGARGWKLDCTIGDPAVIAATAETGDRIPTSVLVHDMLDHYLCGLAMSGHRNEARALVQLASRTGSDPTPDFSQMVDEDVLRGTVNGESFISFLPEGLQSLLPDDIDDDRAARDYLLQTLGRDELRRLLIRQFFAIGEAFQTEAEQSYARHGIDYSQRANIGLELQQILEQIDRLVLDRHYDEAHAEFTLDNSGCSVRFTAPENLPL